MSRCRPATRCRRSRLEPPLQRGRCDLHGTPNCRRRSTATSRSSPRHLRAGRRPADHLRYHDPRAFRSLAVRAERLDLDCSDGLAQRCCPARGGGRPLAEILELVGATTTTCAHGVRRSDEDPGLWRGGRTNRPARRVGRQGQRQPQPPRPADRVPRRVGRHPTGGQGRASSASSRCRATPLLDRTCRLADPEARTSCSTPATRDDLDRAELYYQDLLVAAVVFCRRR